MRDIVKASDSIPERICKVTACSVAATDLSCAAPDAFVQMNPSDVVVRPRFAGGPASIGTNSPVRPSGSVIRGHMHPMGAAWWFGHRLLVDDLHEFVNHPSTASRTHRKPRTVPCAVDTLHADTLGGRKT